MKTAVGASVRAPLHDCRDVMERFFFCYSARLKRALEANGFHYVCIGINERTNSKFWLYVGSNELNDYKDHLYQEERDKF